MRLFSLAWRQLRRDLAAGDIRVLAEIGPGPVPELPGVPTFGELGYPLAPTIFYGLIGPPGLPADVIAKWDATMLAVTSTPRFTGPGCMR